MKRLFIFQFIVFALSAFSIQAQTESKKLEKLAGDYWEFVMADDPQFATYVGDNRFDDRLTDISEAAYKKRYAAAREFLKRTDRIKEQTLSAQERISLKMLRRILALRIEGERFDAYVDEQNSPRPVLMPLNPVDSFHLDFLGLPDLQPFATVKDYENYLARLKAFPKQADDAIANMRSGIRLGVVQPKMIVEKTLPQLEEGFSEDAKTNPLYAPILKIPQNFSDADKRRVSRLIEDAIARDVEPAFRKLFDFVKNEYLPKARETNGFSALPNGAAMYRFWRRVYLTTDYTTDELRAIAERELKQINLERERIIKQSGFNGTIQQFVEKTNADKNLRLFDAASIERDLRENLSFIETRLPQWFADIPPVKYEIKPTPAYKEATASHGQYVSPNADGTRAAVFYYNAYRAGTDGKARFELPNLAAHIMLPGVYLQDTYATTNRDLPAFRRFGWNVGFGQGWSVYAENLADEIGAYRTPEARFFWLSRRAYFYAGILVDIGLGEEGWTRERALEFFKQAAQDGSTEREYDRQISRMTVQPARFIAYPIGALKISELRQKAQRELGAAFDVRAFHSLVLHGGCVPLDVLGTAVDEWIARVKKEK